MNIKKHLPWLGALLPVTSMQAETKPNVVVIYVDDKMCIRDSYNTNPSSQRWNYRLNTDIDVTKTTLVKVGVSGSLKKRNAPGQGSNAVSYTHLEFEG